MQVVCEATQCQDARVKVSALQCLVRIMSLYYQYMEPYMVNALFPVGLLKFIFGLAIVLSYTKPYIPCYLLEKISENICFQISLDAMQSTNEESCLQGIEFWSNVAEEEINLAVEAEEVSNLNYLTIVKKLWAVSVIKSENPLLYPFYPPFIMKGKTLCIFNL